MTKKVICFDGWARGAHHLTRLLSAFNECNLELSLIHFGSWGNEPKSPKFEVVNGLNIFDISYYNGKDLKEILEFESPDLVLFLSLDSFPHKAVNRYCNDLKIPTCHLLHGIHSIYDINSDKPFGTINPFKRLLLMRNHLIKLVFRYWPIYLKALYQTGGTKIDLLRFIIDLKDRFLGKLVSKAAPDSKANHILIYISSDKEYAQSRYGYSNKEITVVGNPDFIDYNISKQNIMACFNSKQKQKEYILYFDTSLVSYGQIFSNDDEFIQFLLKLNNKLCDIGKKLAIKPHPATKKNAYIMQSLSDNNIKVVENESLISSFKKISACIVEPTSIALLPSIFGIPIFLNRVGMFSKQSYGKILLEYPLGIELNNIDDFEQNLETLHSKINENELEEWIIQNNGPFPLNDMPFRVGHIIQGIIQRV